MSLRVLFFAAFALSTTCEANVYRWDTRRVIPGSELIELGSEAEFQDLDLQYAQVCCSMFNSDFSRSNLSHARFWTRSVFGTPSANLANVIFDQANLTNAAFHHADLSEASFLGAELANAAIFSPTFNSSLFDASTRYNQWTRFPEGFDPAAAGLRLITVPEGDFDANGVVDDQDIDLLHANLRDEVSPIEAWKNEKFDLNQDASNNSDDARVWVKELQQTYYGDANLDGEFNSIDLVDVFGAGQYEDAFDGLSGWSDGDWNGDGDFNSRDLVLALADGGYEKGPNDGSESVPEPDACLLLSLGMLAFLRRRHSLSGGNGESPKLHDVAA